MRLMCGCSGLTQRADDSTVSTLAGSSHRLTHFCSSEVFFPPLALQAHTHRHSRCTHTHTLTHSHSLSLLSLWLQSAADVSACVSLARFAFSLPCLASVPGNWNDVKVTNTRLQSPHHHHHPLPPSLSLHTRTNTRCFSAWQPLCVRVCERVSALRNDGAQTDEANTCWTAFSKKQKWLQCLRK